MFTVLAQDLIQIGGNQYLFPLDRKVVQNLNFFTYLTT